MAGRWALLMPPCQAGYSCLMGGSVCVGGGMPAGQPAVGPNVLQSPHIVSPVGPGRGAVNRHECEMSE